jgi:hypothetical protein
MSTTNGSNTLPSRDEVIRLSTYYAAIHNYFDTSDAAQKSGQLVISVMDMAHFEKPFPAGATHRFYVFINQVASVVTRYADDRYEVELPDNLTEDQRREHELREAVLDYAVWQLTGEGAGYKPADGPEARAAAIQELLTEDEEEREAVDPHPHPVLREEAPDIFIAGDMAGGPAPRAARQWRVTIGGYSCTVAFFGYDTEDGSPFLVTSEADPDDDEGLEEFNDEEDEEE